MRAEALLSGGDTGRIMDVAALADSLDYMADIIHSTVLQQGDAASHDAQTPGRRRSGDGMPLARRSDASGGALTEGLAHLVDRHVVAPSPAHVHRAAHRALAADLQL